MSDFIKLNKIAKRNGDIASVTLGTNLKSATTGAKGWGEVVIALTNEMIGRINNGEMVGALYITSKKEWQTEEIDE